MSVLQHYSQDEQFLRLVRREQDVDLVVAALEIARDDLETFVDRYVEVLCLEPSEAEELRERFRQFCSKLDS